MSKEALEYLLGGGGLSQTWPSIGTECKGRLVSMEKRQATDIDGNKKVWDNGDPMWQIVYTIDTGIIDPAIEDDDGIRKVYSKKNIDDAVRDALKKAGFKGDPTGGKLGIKYVADGEPPKRGYSAPKLFAARFEPPSAEDMLNEAAGPEAAPDPVQLTEYGEEVF